MSQGFGRACASSDANLPNHANRLPGGSRPAGSCPQAAAGSPGGRPGGGRRPEGGCHWPMHPHCPFACCSAGWPLLPCAVAPTSDSNVLCLVARAWHVMRSKQAQDAPPSRLPSLTLCMVEHDISTRFGPPAQALKPLANHKPLTVTVLKHLKARNNFNSLMLFV